MLRENQATRLNVVRDPSAPQADPILRAVQDAAAGDFEVLGELGRGSGGMIVYLAREQASQRLVALRLQREGNLPDEFSLELARHLDASMPAPDSVCFKCGKTLRGWGRFCSYCGADLGGAAPKEGDAGERAMMLAAVKEAVAGEYEVLGEMSRNEGGGAVYFARDLKSRKIVALRLQQEGPGGDFSLGLTTAMKPLAASLGVKPVATQVISAVTPPPAAAPPAAPPARPAPAPPPAPAKAAAAPGAPPPLPAAARGLSGRTKALLAAAAGVVVVAAVLVFTLPRSGPAPVPPPQPAPDTTRPAAAPAAPADTAHATPTPAPAPPPAPKPRPVAPARATIRVRGLPEGTTVTIDGRPRSGSSFVLEPGRHVLSVNVAGYQPRTDTLHPRAGETVIWSPALAPVARANHAPAAAAGGPGCAKLYADEKWSQAFETCVREAGAGSAAAKRYVAQLYEHGRGVDGSDENAARWYENAARSGDRDAMFQIASWYERGKGVKKDQAQALEWYTRAANAGSAAAQYYLGETYEKGRLGVKKDKAAALAWYQKAAAQNYKGAADKVKDLSK